MYVEGNILFSVKSLLDLPYLKLILIKCNNIKLVSKLGYLLGMFTYARGVIKFFLSKKKYGSYFESIYPSVHISLNLNISCQITET